MQAETSRVSLSSSPYKTILVTVVCPKPMRKRDVWRIDQFHLVKKIGSGYASSVYLGTCHLTGNQVAIKLYHKNKLSELNLFQVSREIRIHGALDHKNIVQMWAAFEDQYGIYLVTEYASRGDVFTEVERRGGQMTEVETVRQVIFPFCSALTYLHKNDIIHRDIKPENLLFTATGVLKVGDFGLSINVSQERPVTRVGTLDYMAPEVVICPDKQRPSDNKEMKHLYYTCLVDAWAVGVLAYELIVGRPPFDKGAKKATIHEIINGEPFVPPWLSEGASHFIRWSLTKSQRDRPGVQQLMEHPWVMAHMAKGGAAALTRPAVFGRADSFVEPRMVGLAPDSPIRSAAGAEHAPSTSNNNTMAANPSLSAIKANAKPFLQHSNSLNAADAIRFRDLKFDPASPQHQQQASGERAAGGGGGANNNPFAAQKVSSPGMLQVGAVPMATAGAFRSPAGAAGAGGGMPSLEHRLANLQVSGHTPSVLTNSPSARRMSGLDNVLGESRSRRQSGVGHSLPDPVAPLSPPDHTTSPGSGGGHSAHSSPQVANNLLQFANGPADFKRSASVNNRDAGGVGVPWPGLDIGPTSHSALLPPGSGRSGGGTDEAHMFTNPFPGSSQRSGVGLSSGTSSPRAGNSRLSSFSSTLAPSGDSSPALSSPLHTAGALAAPSRARSVTLATERVNARPSPLRSVPVSEGASPCVMESAFNVGGGGGTPPRPGGSSAGGAGVAALPPHPHYHHHRSDAPISAEGELTSPERVVSAPLSPRSASARMATTPHLSRLSSSQASTPSPLRNSSFARVCTSDQAVLMALPPSEASLLAASASLIAVGSSGDRLGVGMMPQAPASPRPQAPASPRLSFTRPSLVLENSQLGVCTTSNNSRGGGSGDSLAFEGTVVQAPSVAKAPVAGAPSGGRTTPPAPLPVATTPTLPNRPESPVTPSSSSPRGVDTSSPKGAGSPKGDGTEGKKGIFASFKRVFS